MCRQSPGKILGAAFRKRLSLLYYAGSRPTRSSARLSKKNTIEFIICRQSPDKILDAPDLVDDYYLNLLDWCGRECAAKICAAAAGAKFSRVEHSRRNDRRDC